MYGGWGETHGENCVLELRHLDEEPHSQPAVYGYQYETCMFTSYVAVALTADKYITQ